ncbi:MAG: septum formation initiator family protein [Eubacterium sp.]|nr:septum formation initiator family protein [Eubacterium sp.]
MPENKKLKLKLKKNSKLFFLLIPVFVIALGVCFYNFVAVQVEIAQKNNELAALSAQRDEIDAENEMLIRYSKDEYKVEYIENIARDKLGYAQPEERIYYIVPAN